MTHPYAHLEYMKKLSTLGGLVFFPHCRGLRKVLLKLMAEGKTPSGAGGEIAGFICLNQGTSASRQEQFQGQQIKNHKGENDSSQGKRRETQTSMYS